MIEGHAIQPPPQCTTRLRCGAVYLLAIGFTVGCSAGDKASRRDTAEPTPTSTGTGMNANSGTGGAPPLEVGNAPMVAAAGAPGDMQVGGVKPGTFVPSAMLDPDAVFDWPEAIDGGKCESGTYTGTFECTFMIDPAQADMLLFAPTDMPPVTGPITLTFEKSADGEFLELTNAQLVGTGMDVIGFDAQLSGRLDCATMQLTAQLTTGEFGFGSPVLFQFGELSGDLTGTLDGQTGTITGEWSLSPGPPDMKFGECKGPWTANFTP